MAMIVTYNCYLSEITELKYTSLIKIIIKDENFKWHLEAFANREATKHLTTGFTEIISFLKKCFLKIVYVSTPDNEHK